MLVRGRRIDPSQFAVANDEADINRGIGLGLTALPLPDLISLILAIGCLVLVVICVTCIIRERRCCKNAD